jgi:O-antigen ligase
VPVKTPVSVVVRHTSATLSRAEAGDHAALWDSLLLLGLGMVIAFSMLAFGATEPWAELILECGAAALFLLWAARQATEGAIEVRPSPLYFPALAFALLVAVQLVTGISVYRYATLHEAMRYLAYGMLMFVAIQCFRSRGQIQRFLTGMTIFGALLALFGMVQDFTSNGKLYWIRRPQFVSWSFGPYPNHSHWAGAMELLTPIPLALMLRRRAGMGQRVLLGFITLIMASTIFLSGSRGGMISFAVQVALGAALLLLRGRSSERIRDIAILAVIGVIFLAWVGGSRVSSRIESAYSADGATMGNTLDARFRLALFRDTLSMAKARPIMGWGLDCFTRVFPGFQSFYSDRFVNAAHNDYLQLLAETGVIGFAIMLWFLIAMFRSGLRRRVPPGFVSPAKMAATLACTGILVHSLVDFNLHVPANAALFYVMASLASAEAVEGSSPVMEPHSGPVLVHDITLS